MTTSSSRRGLARTVQSFGALAALIGVSLTAAPLVASAEEPTTRRVVVEVTVGDFDNEATLAGASVVLRAQPDGNEVATSRTGLDGRVTFDVDTAAFSQYSAHATWPNSDSSLLNGAREFRSIDAEVVGVPVEGTYRFVSGRIVANVGDAPVADLTGGTVAIAHSGVTVQTLPLAADGTFASKALPTDGAEAYRLTFTPPSTHAMAGGQADPTFALPVDPAGATTLTLAPVFAVTRTAIPEPTPTPAAPVAPPVQLPHATHLGGAMDGITTPYIEFFERATQQAGPGNVVPITNSIGQVLGLASAPTAPDAQALAGLVTSMNSSMPGVSVTGISFTTMDLETALMTVQSNRATLLEEQLKSQISAVQAKNDNIAKLNDALRAVNAYVSVPTAERLGEARASVRTAGMQSDPFLNGGAPSQGSIDAILLTLKGSIDSMGNSQQMDMLRLQSLSNKRNEAFDVMTNFVKKMQESRSSIIGNMRSEPVAIGTVQWNNGVVTQPFDLSGVPNGSHHLILRFADAGVTIIADVDVQREVLPVTGASTGAGLPIGFGMLLLGLVAVAGARVLRHREEVTRTATPSTR